MMRGKKNTIVLNLNDFDALKILNDDQLGRLFRALFKHYRGEKCEIEDDIGWPFRWVSAEIDRYNKNYLEVCEIRSVSGQKGGLKRSEAIANVAKLANVAKVAKLADTDNDNDLDIIIEIKRVLLFEKLICPVQCEFERFWNHYSKNGWTDGNGVLITNKIACVKNWKIDGNKSLRKLSSVHAKAWKKVYDLLKDKEKNELMLTDIYGFKLINGTLVISCTKQLYDFVESNLTEDVCTAIFKGFGCQKVEYKMVVNNEEQ